METGPFSFFYHMRCFCTGYGESNSFRSSAPSTLLDVTYVRLALIFSWFTTELEGWDSLYVRVFFDVHLLIPIHRFILDHDLRFWKLCLTPNIYSLN